MKQGKSKVWIIVLVIIAVLAILGGVFAYLYFATDMFRSGKELFAKYLIQDLNQIKETVTLEKLNDIAQMKKQNKYEGEAKISYAETGSDESTVFLTSNIQNDPINKKYYGIIALMLGDTEQTLKVEYMKENDIYSLRFTNAVKQFLSVENNNLKQFAQNLGLSEEEIQQIPDKIDPEKFSIEKLKFTDEEKNAEFNKYLQLLYNGIAEEKYVKGKNKVITLNGKTVTTNAYVLTLNEQDIKNLTINILENLKQDEIVLSKLQVIDDFIDNIIDESLQDNFTNEIQERIDELKKEDNTQEQDTTQKEDDIVITLYEQSGKTVRIKFEQGLDTITIDTIEEQKSINFNFTSIDEENTMSTKEIVFIKENDNNLTIQLNNIEGEEKQTNEINIQLSEKENNVILDITISNEEYGKININNNTNFLDEIQYNVILDNSNNIILNQLSTEQISNMFSLLEEALNAKYIEPIKSSIPLFNVANSIGETTIPDLDEQAIQLSNSMFTIYEGSNKTVTDVNSLLNTVLAHNLQEKESETNHFIAVSGDVTLEADATSIQSVEGNSYYSIETKTNESGWINEIVIMQENE